MASMNTTATITARIDVLAATLRALASALPPDGARRALATLGQELCTLEPTTDDTDAASAGELHGLLLALTTAAARTETPSATWST